MKSKVNLRKEMIQKRDEIPEEIRQEKSERILSKVLKHPKFMDAEHIFMYMGFGSEINTKEFAKIFIELGKKVYIPHLGDRESPMEIVPLTDPDFQLEPGYMGILEIKDEFINIQDPKIIDLIIMPGVAFDKTGNRIGYGGGYYDRFIERTKDTIYLLALCYKEQIVDVVPTEDHDKVMDEVITD